MKYLVSVPVLCCLLFISACQKRDKSKEPPVESIDIHTVGGIGGFNYHFLISDGKVYRDTSTYSYDHPHEYLWTKELPKDKYDKVKQLLYEVPLKMFEDGSKVYGVTQDSLVDGMATWAGATKDGKTYRWGFEAQSPAYASAFAQKVADAIETLTD